MKKNNKVIPKPKTNKKIFPNNPQKTYLCQSITHNMKNLLPTLLLLCLSQALTAQSDQLIDSLSKIYTNITYYKNTPFLEVTQKGKYGLSKPKTDSLYDEILQLNENSPTIAAKKNGFWGLIDSTGKEIGRWDYDELKLIRRAWICKKEAKEGIISYNGKELIPPIYDKVVGTDYGFKVELDDKMGFADFEGNIRIPVEFTGYKSLGWEDEFGFGMDFYSEDEMSEVDEPNTENIDYHAFLYKDTLASLWNMKDFKEVFPAIYNDITSLSSGRYLIKKNNKLGVIDSVGKIIIPTQHLNICEKNLIKTHYIISDTIVTKVQMKDKPSGFNRLQGNLSCVNDTIKTPLWGLYNSLGEEILPQKYENIAFINDTLFLVTQNDCMGIIDIKDNSILPMSFDKILIIKTTPILLVAKKDNKTTIYNLQGQAIKTEFSKYFVFEEGKKEYLWLNNKNNFRLIDSAGNNIVSYDFDSKPKVYPIIYGKIKGKTCYIAPNGRIAAKGDYLLKEKWGEYNVLKNKNKKALLINSKGEKLGEFHNVSQIFIKIEFELVEICKKNKKALFSTKTKKLLTKYLVQDFYYRQNEITVKRPKGIYTINANGEKIDPKPETEYIHSINIIENKYLTAIIDTMGKTIIPLNTQTINVYKNFITVYNPSKEIKEVYDYQGKNLFPHYDYYFHKDNVVFLTDSTSKKGIGTLDGKIQLPFEWEKLEIFSDTWKAEKKGKWALLSKSTKQPVTDFKYKDIDRLSAYLNMAKTRKHWQLIDNLGHPISRHTFEKIYHIPFFSLLVVHRKNKFAVIDKYGKQLTPFFSSKSTSYKTEITSRPFIIPATEYVSIKETNSQMIVSNNGRISQKYDSLNFDDFHNTLYIYVQKGKYWGALNTQLEESIPPLYINISHLNSLNKWNEVLLHDALLLLQKTDSTYVMYSTKDKKIISDAHLFIDKGRENRFAFSDDKKMLGYLNNNGSVIITPRFEVAGSFIDNRAIVQINGKSGIIDTMGNWLLKPEYEALNLLENGYAVVKENCKFRLINQAYQVVGSEYDMIDYLILPETPNCKYFLALRDNQFTCIDNTGREVIPYMFDNILSNYQTFLIVEKNQKQGVWDIQKQALVIPCEHESLEFIGSNADCSYFQTSHNKDDLNHNVGLISSKNETILPPIFKLNNDLSTFTFTNEKKKVVFFKDTGTFKEENLPSYLIDEVKD